MAKAASKSKSKSKKSGKRRNGSETAAISQAVEGIRPKKASRASRSKPVATGTNQRALSYSIADGVVENRSKGEIVAQTKTWMQNRDAIYDLRAILVRAADYARERLRRMGEDPHSKDKEIIAIGKALGHEVKLVPGKIVKGENGKRDPFEKPVVASRGGSGSSGSERAIVRRSSSDDAEEEGSAGGWILGLLGVILLGGLGYAAYQWWLSRQVEASNNPARASAAGLPFWVPRKARPEARVATALSVTPAPVTPDLSRQRYNGQVWVVMSRDVLGLRHFVDQRWFNVFLVDGVERIFDGNNFDRFIDSAFQASKSNPGSVRMQKADGTVLYFLFGERRDMPGTGPRSGASVNRDELFVTR